MKLFLSYASESASVAEEIELALVGEGHEVFFDRPSTIPGDSYNLRLRQGIEAADGMIFLISSHSVQPGSYTLTELKYARRKWVHPAKRVLPVMVEPTPFDAIPPYLRTVTILQPEGNIPAEVTDAIKSWSTATSPGSTRSPTPSRRRSLLYLGLGGFLAAGGSYVWVASRRRPAVSAGSESLARADVYVTAEEIRRAILSLLPQSWERTLNELASFGYPSGWVAAQVACAIGHAPEAREEHFRVFDSVLHMMWQPGYRQERNGIPYGWLYGGAYTTVYPSLWISAALSGMLRRDISVNEVRKINYEDRLRYAQKTTAVFESTEAGRWNVFADQIERGEESVYANALALMALLDAKSANLPWMHSTDQRDALLRATAAVLIDQFEVTSRRSGWRPNVGLAAAQKLAQTVSQELSCMVAAQLLRAEEFEQIRVPAPILAEVDRLLERLASRAFDWTYSTGYYARTFKDLNGRTVAQQANVTFLWYPWAVALCAQTLQRSERLKDVDRGSRATKCLKHLVVDFKDQVLGELTAVDSSSWHQAESLYALSFVVDRDPIGVHTNE